jgi:hypothetical protein
MASQTFCSFAFIFLGLGSAVLPVTARHHGVIPYAFVEDVKTSLCQNGQTVSQFLAAHGVVLGDREIHCISIEEAIAELCFVGRWRELVFRKSWRSLALRFLPVSFEVATAFRP